VGVRVGVRVGEVHLAARRCVERAAALVRQVALEARVVHLDVALRVQPAAVDGAVVAHDGVGEHEAAQGVDGATQREAGVDLLADERHAVLQPQILQQGTAE
jgi:hypothetical protein